MLPKKTTAHHTSYCWDFLKLYRSQMDTTTVTVCQSPPPPIALSDYHIIIFFSPPTTVLVFIMFPIIARKKHYWYRHNPLWLLYTSYSNTAHLVCSLVLQPLWDWEMPHLMNTLLRGVSHSLKKALTQFDWRNFVYIAPYLFSHTHLVCSFVSQPLWEMPRKQINTLLLTSLAYLTPSKKALTQFDWHNLVSVF